MAKLIIPVTIPPAAPEANFGILLKKLKIALKDVAATSQPIPAAKVKSPNPFNNALDNYSSFSSILDISLLFFL